MLGQAMLVMMFDYNAAMNARLLALAAKLDDARLDASGDYGHGSLRQTLLHLLTVEWAWRTVCQEHAAPTSPPPVVQAPTIPALREFAETEARQARAFLDSLSDDDLTAPFTSERGGKIYRFVPWQVLVHLLYHSAQHRAEAAMLLSRYGQAPGDLDFVFFANPETRS